ncbi:MAG: hypothetical protein ACXVOH_06930 [Bacteroidia bacterium]
MSFNGTEGSFITLTQGATWTANHRNANPNMVKAHYYGKNKILTIFDQPGCVGIRAYRAIDDNGLLELVLVGVTSAGADITSGYILDRSLPCPTYCDGGSSLYSNGGGQ